MRLSQAAVAALRAPNLCVSLLEHVERCNRISTSSEWLPLVVDGQQVGSIADAKTLVDAGRAFEVRGASVGLAAGLDTVHGRTEAVADVTAALRASGVVTGWRDELVSVAPAFGADPAFLVERAAYPLLGCKGYGVHCNGFVMDDGIKLWVARRAKTKQTWPGLLDHLVAGHQPFDLSPLDNVVKEAGEEAGIEPDLARNAAPVGAVSYRGLDEQGRLKDDVLFCFDLELPPTFVPVAVDGEVDEFMLWDLDQVLDNILDGRFKPNVVIVIVDFLMRQGALLPHMAGYLDLLRALRQGDCR